MSRPDHPKPNTPKNLIEKGVRQYQKQNFFEAEELYFQALEKLGADGSLHLRYVAHSNLASLYRDQGRLDKALESAERALALEPSNEKAKTKVKRIRAMQLAQKIQTFARSSQATKTMLAANAEFAKHTNKSHAFSNELKVDDALDTYERSSFSSSSNQLNVAILTGEAYFLSRLHSLKAAGIDLVIVVDIQDIALEHSQFMLGHFQRQEDKRAFGNGYVSDKGNPTLKRNYKVKLSNGITTNLDASILASNLQAQFSSAKVSISGGKIKEHEAHLPRHHTLATDENFNRAKAAEKALEICFLRFDWTDVNQASELRTLLDSMNASVRICHVSNVGDYDAAMALRDIVHLWDAKKSIPWQPKRRLEKSLTVLQPKDGNWFIEYSRLDKCDNFFALYAQVVQSINAFTEDHARMIATAQTNFYGDVIPSATSGGAAGPQLFARHGDAAAAAAATTTTAASTQTP